VTGCFSTGKASLQVKDNALDTKDAVKWSLKKSDGFDQATLGNPATSRVYSLCIYDETAGVPSLKATITIDPNANWASKDPKGYSYRDKLGSEDGVIKAALKTGITGKTAVSISAKGVNIPMPAPFSTSKFFNADTGVTAQLVNNQTATCWTSRFTLPKKNDPAQYKATTP
jgi:hypothetical protein